METYYKNHKEEIDANTARTRNGAKFQDGIYWFTKTVHGSDPQNVFLGFAEHKLIDNAKLTKTIQEFKPDVECMGIAEYIMYCWNKHYVVNMDPMLFTSAVLANLALYIDRNNVQGVFSGQSEKMDLIVVTTPDTFPWGDFLELVFANLTEPARETLEPVKNIIQSLGENKKVIQAGCLATSLLGAMKSDFRYATAKCALISKIQCGNKFAHS